MVTATREELQAIDEILAKARELAERLKRLDQLRFEAEFEEAFERTIEAKYDNEDDCLIVRDDVIVSDDDDDDYMTMYEEDPDLSDDEEQAYEESIDEYLAELACAQGAEDVTDTI